MGGKIAATSVFISVTKFSARMQGDRYPAPPPPPWDAFYQCGKLSLKPDAAPFSPLREKALQASVDMEMSVSREMNRTSDWLLGNASVYVAARCLPLLLPPFWLLFSLVLKGLSLNLDLVDWVGWLVSTVQ